MNPAELYLRVREKEGRFLSDNLVLQLPNLPAKHPLAKEWRSRSISVSRLVRHLSGYPRPSNILEVGCGNGWLSNQLAHIPGAQVFGLDRKVLNWLRRIDCSN
ncbi:MAG: class I SAM-dependent methyltransferase [Anaerolineae bacterium]|nr:class I SAM-dependent methyltransferase [Anaerolineae bacterium]